MIQEITPHKFKNEFRVKRPSQESYAFYFRHDKILLKYSDPDNDQSVTLLQFYDLAQRHPEVYDHNDYLFSIDKREYYLIDETEVVIPESSSCVFCDTNVFHSLRPKWVAFAGITGTQLRRFYRDHTYCGRCGHEMEKSFRERALSCPSCRHIEYPKISPAIAVAVLDKDNILLTRYADRDYTGYALIAGFVEIGETLEQAVEREVMEETGLRVKNITYYKNQPWSFSDSLIVGFYADLVGSSRIRMDSSELSSAEWVSRENIPDDFSDLSLSHEMIKRFRYAPQAVQPDTKAPDNPEEKQPS